MKKNLSIHSLLFQANQPSLIVFRIRLRRYLTCFFTIFFFGFYGIAQGAEIQAQSPFHARVSSEILNSQSLQKLDQIQKDLSEYEEAYAHCQTQLKLKAAPVDCFSVIDFEKTWELLHGTHWRNLRSQLTQLCQSSGKLMSATMDRLKKGLASIPTECKDELLEKHQNKQYMEMESKPLNSFHQRESKDFSVLD